MERFQPQRFDNPPESDERYRALFKLAPDIIFSIAVPEGTLSDLSPSFESIVGWPASDWIGKPAAAFLHSDDFPLAQAMFAKVLRGEPPPPYELRARTQRGDYVTLEIRAVPWIKGGKVVEVFGVARDTTQRKRTERIQAVLAEAAEVLDSPFDLSETLARAARLPLPIFGDWTHICLVEDGRVHRVAAAHADASQEALLAELVQVAPPDLSKNSVLSMVLATGQPALLEKIADDFLQSQAITTQHLDLLRGLTPHSAIIVPLSVRGRTVGALTIVSARPGRHYDADDLAVAEVLARPVGLAIENARLFAGEREAREAAQAAAREREEFLSLAAHELKTPITSLQGYAQIFVRRFEKEGTVSPDRVRAAFQIIAQQGSRLARLVNRLLDDNHLKAGALTLQPERIDLTELVERVTGDVQEVSASHALELHTSGPALVTVDPLLFEQVLVNLLDNAVRYSPDGGPVEITVSPTALAEVSMRVRDFGVGIPADQRAHLFDRFHRAHDASYRSGLGLGLSICRRIVELHGGRIDAEFPSDGGTCFVVTLPLDPASQQ